MTDKAIFLDRDGVIIHEKGYLKDPAGVELIDGVGLALKAAQEAGFLLFILSNQSGVQRGLMTKEEMISTFYRMEEILYKDFGVTFQDRYIALKEEDMKPNPVFINQACKTYDIDKNESYICGDKVSDCLAGIYAGLWGKYLVRTGHGNEFKEDYLIIRDCRVEVKNNLPEVIEEILEFKKESLDYKYDEYS